MCSGSVWPKNIFELSEILVNLVKKYILLRQAFLIKEMYTVLKVYIFKKFKM